jgi:hypothetical protein
MDLSSVKNAYDLDSAPDGQFFMILRTYLLG